MRNFTNEEQQKVNKLALKGSILIATRDALLNEAFEINNQIEETANELMSIARRIDNSVAQAPDIFDESMNYTNPNVDFNIGAELQMKSETVTTASKTLADLCNLCSMVKGPLREEILYKLGELEDQI